MKVFDLNGYEHNWPPKGHQVNLEDSRPKSKAHLQCRNMLRQLFPTQRILEEIPLPNERLILDFFLPVQHKAIEVQGEQHYTYNNFFYENKFEFAKAKARDQRKKDWCKINNIILIELKHNEIDQWEKQIKDL